jgi:predicted XRE-type DNA-binding protein
MPAKSGFRISVSFCLIKLDSSKISVDQGLFGHDNKESAPADNPIRAQNLRLRSELLIRITEELGSLNLSQVKIAEKLEITQPRVCALKQGKIEKFRLDSLVDIAHRLGLNVSLEVAA